MICDSSKRVEVLLGGKWTEVEFQWIEQGDIFRLYYRETLLGTYKALCDPYYNIDLHEFEVAIKEMK